MSSPSQGAIPQRGINEIIVTTTFLVLAILAVIARFYSRYLQQRPYSVDDYIIIASLISTAAAVGVGYALVLKGGAGLHREDVTSEQFSITLKLFVAAPLLWVISTSLVKLSVLCFYMSIFTFPRIRKAVYVVISLTIALIFAVILESFLLCRPFKFTWDKEIQGGVCGNAVYAYLAISIINLVIDFAVVLLPMPILWKLQMPVGKKVAISAMLGLGIVICALSAARVKSVLALDTADFTYNLVYDLILGALELELGIVNACLPILRPLILKIFATDSVIFRGWSNKAEPAGGPKTYKNIRISKNRNFECLSSSMYPLDEIAPGVSSNETTAQVQDHTCCIHYTQEGKEPGPGEIRVQKDVYLYRFSAFC